MFILLTPGVEWVLVSRSVSRHRPVDRRPGLETGVVVRCQRDRPSACFDSLRLLSPPETVHSSVCRTKRLGKVDRNGRSRLHPTSSFPARPSPRPRAVLVGVGREVRGPGRATHPPTAVPTSSSRGGGGRVPRGRRRLSRNSTHPLRHPSPCDYSHPADCRRKRVGAWGGR